MRTSRRQLSAVLFLLLVSSVSLLAQTRSSAPAADSDAGYPEQAYLSASRYTNQYFDFSFDLPPEAHLQPVPQPAARDGSIQLLEMGGPAPVDAEISIAAIPTAGGSKQDAKAFLRYALDQELYRGVEELRGLSKASIGGHQFYLFETRRGIEQHVVIATTVADYILRVVLAAHDEKMVHRLEASFDHVTFFAPADLRQYVDSEARSYDGPAISTHRLAALEADPPAKYIDSGKINGDFYENPTIGFSYRIPQGWVLEANGAVQPAIERDRDREDFGRPRVGRTEHRLMEACSRTLFSAWAKRPSADGQVSYDEFGEVTVSAISLACFPRMKFPTDASDQRAAKDFLLQFALTHPIVDDMRDGKAFTAGGNVFLFLHGTVGFQVPNDELSRRLSIGMAITQRRGYLLTWFFAAPHDQELQALTDERVSFDSSPPATVLSSTQPGGASASAGSASAAAPSSTAAPGATTAATSAPAAGSAASQSPTSDESNTTSNESSSNAQSTATPGDPSAATQSGADSDRPSLLRPGETMQSQQGKGTPIPPKKQSR